MFYFEIKWLQSLRSDRRIDHGSLSLSRKDVCLVDHWEILPDEITCKEKIGHGQFGEVHIAEMKSRDTPQKGKLRSKGQWTDKLHRPKIIVAVKMLCGK